MRAVDGLDMSVCAGDVFGFLGPNGAGKTTVIRLALGLIHPTSGHVEIAGTACPATAPERAAPRRRLRRRPHLLPAHVGASQPAAAGQHDGPVSEERIDEVLEIVGLRERAESRVGGFSHGMKQRLGIAQALLHAPDLIVLDEPTSGLDPRGMKDVRELDPRPGRGRHDRLPELAPAARGGAGVHAGRHHRPRPRSGAGPVSELRPADGGRQGAHRRSAHAPTRRCAPASARQAVADDEGYLVVQVDDGRRARDWSARSWLTSSTCAPSCRPRSRAWRTSSWSSRRTTGAGRRAGAGRRRPLAPACGGRS